MLAAAFTFGASNTADSMVGIAMSAKAPSIMPMAASRVITLATTMNAR